MQVWRGAGAELDEAASLDARPVRWFVVRLHDRRTGAQGMQIVRAADCRAALLEVAYDGRTFTELRVTEVIEGSEARQ